jgi:hypothetical protein
MSRRKGRKSHDLLGALLIVFGILFTVGGVLTVAEMSIASSALGSSGFGGSGLSSITSGYEAMGIVLIGIGLLMIIGGAYVRR